jgi:ATP-dependent DNA helicase DinG
MLSEHDDGTFFSYSIPRAIIAWKQGVGRLLRTIEDRGVVVCLDPRILTKWDSYGQKFYNCLPRMSLSRDLGHISTFLKGSLNEAR